MINRRMYLKITPFFLMILYASDNCTLYVPIILNNEFKFIIIVSMNLDIAEYPELFELLFFYINNILIYESFSDAGTLDVNLLLKNILEIKQELVYLNQDKYCIRILKTGYINLYFSLFSNFISNLLGTKDIKQEKNQNLVIYASCK